MILKSDTSGIDALIARIRKARTDLPRITTNAAQRAGDTVKAQLARAAPHGRSGGPPPPGDSSGPLASSFSAQASQQGIGAHMELKTSQPLKLQYVTLGTGIYVGKGPIRPLVKRALFWPGSTHPYRSVKGMKGKDFVKPVLDKRGDAVKAEMQKAIQEIQAILGGA